MTDLRTRDFQAPGRSTVLSSGGMVATSHPAAAAAGRDMLRAGGNAADAAVAAALMLNLCEPQMTSLAGDAFAIFAAPGAAPVGLNASGRAPAGLDVDALRAEHGDGPVPSASAHAVTVPGAVLGLWTLIERFGRRDFGEVAAAAIAAAETGVPIAPRVAFDAAEATDALQGAARAHYARPDASPLQTGDILRAPGQAEILRRVAAEGPAGFYQGEVAADLVDSLRAAGGTHTLDDFAAGALTDAPPLATTFRGREVLELPPNTQGAAALLALDILGGLPLDDLDPLGTDRAHVETETVKLAYDARNRFVADPESFPETAERMRAPGLAERLRALIDPARAFPPAEIATLAGAAHRDTVYIAAVDRDGGACSLIVSLFGSFGSGIASEKFGVLFHNRGSGFTLKRGHPNEAAPGKRPLHTLVPGMLRDPASGRITGVFGVMGGQYQAAGHARLLSNLEIYGMDPQNALDAPRLMQEADGLRIERGYAEPVFDALVARGHAAYRSQGPIGGGQLILVDHKRGVFVGASDSRKDGAAIGI